MKKMLFAFSFGLALVGTVGSAQAKSCGWSDVGRLKEHLAKHITYPAKGKAIKEACKKEAPDEFTAAERACTESKLKDAVEYKSADDVMKTLGVQ
jgi:hypothetical protein